MAKEQPEKLTGTSLDISAENRTRLKALFPAVFTETRNDKGDLVESIDFEKLKAELGTFSDLFESRRERYGMDWPGKKEALRLIQTPSAATLRPCREESVNFDTTGNLFIEGDNLEVLKLLQNSYYGKVKVIEIDPPYNTGKEFIYPDNFSESLQTYLEYAGLIDGDGKKFSTNTVNEGRFHTKWLNMMYPRLYLARNLLKDDGVIFIHIDDNEVNNLRKLCDEIFGEDNFVSTLVWEKKKKGTFLSNTITSVKEYIHVYAKNKPAFNGLIGEINSETETYPCINASNKRDVRSIQPGIKSLYREKNFKMKSGERISDTTMDLLLLSDLVVKNGILESELKIEGNWRYTQANMSEYAKNAELYITRDLYLRRIVSDPREKTLKDLLSRTGDDENASHREINLNNLFADGWGSNEDGEEELRQIMNAQGLMDFPKPRKLIEKLAVSVRDSDSIILDFFAGSATTAHAVLDLNKQDGGNRKFIMVQLPEPCPPDSEAFKAGYKTIADIGKERIRRVIKKIEDERANQDKKNSEALPGMLKEQPSIDLGFKVLKLNKSNFKPWQKLDPSAPVEKIEKQLELHIDHINPEATPEDLLYEILLKTGYRPTEKIETKIIAGIDVFSISDGGLLFCLEKPVTKELIDAVAEAEPMQFICLDSAFHGNDQLKANSVQTFAARNMQREKHNKIVFKTV